MRGVRTVLADAGPESEDKHGLAGISLIVPRVYEPSIIAILGASEYADAVRQNMLARSCGRHDSPDLWLFGVHCGPSVHGRAELAENTIRNPCGIAQD